MMDLLLKTVFIIVSLKHIATDSVVTEIGCWKAFAEYKSYACGQRTCRARCKQNCLNAETPRVRGTVQYTKESPICKSALHDSRISSWNDSLRTVEFERIENETRILLISSLRQRIQSYFAYEENEYYIFTSPRVPEEVLDITSLHHNYLFEDNKEHKQECRIAAKHNRSVSFNPYNRGNPKWPSPIMKGSYVYYETTWKGDDMVRAFWCRPENSMFSSILSPAMRIDADFQPAQLTMTVNVGDRITLEMYTSQSIGHYNYKWRKDDENVGKRHEIIYDSVRVGNAGIYTLEDEYGERKMAGVIRLIVRVCEEGMYGPLCDHKCSQCLNGGVCHDITGECICPPGFNGSDCGNACGNERFGKDCSQTCSNEQDKVISCKEILFCLPDPYGCSCISGFHTIYCNETCKAGKYGAGCTQTCSVHCKNATGLERLCDPYTGYCESGCEDGWHGKSCFFSYPVLKNEPIVNITDSNNITIFFKSWKPGVDIGVGEVKSYIIEYKLLDDDSNNWTSGEEIFETDGIEMYTATIENPKPDSKYSVRVIIIDKSGSKQINNVPEETVQTKCGVPQEPPVDISINASLPRLVFVKWKLPSNGTWQCSNVTVTLSYLIESTEREPVTVKELWQFEFSFEIEPYTNFSVKLMTVNKDGYNSNWSDTHHYTSGEDAPGPVTNISYKYKSRQLFLTWGKPTEENGIIRMYHIQYYQLSWRHDKRDKRCTVNNVNKTIFTNITNAVIDVYPSAIYNVHVLAETIKYGSWNDIEALSEEEAPDGPPINPQVSGVSSKELKFKWNPPECNVSNGKIIGYRCMLNALEDWGENQPNKSSLKSEITFSNLSPFTTYTLQVFAETKAGVSDQSATITKVTGSEKPPPPTSLTVYHRTANLMSLSWKPPYPPKGQLEKYEVTYKLLKTRRRKTSEYVFDWNCTKEGKEALHCYLLSDLKPNQNYSIEVCAYNKHIYRRGDCAETYGETSESVPDPPDKLEVVNYTETSLDLAWKEPTIINGNLTNYTINITALHSYNTSVINQTQSATTNPNIVSICFKDLHPATTYNVTITASTAVGPGLPATRLFKTRQSVPIIDFEPEVTHVTESTVELKIMPIKFTGGPISGYFVIVREIKNRKKREIEKLRLISYNISVENEIDYYIAANFTPQEIDSRTNFTVGDGKTYNDFYNAPLVAGHKYRFGIAVLSNFSGEERIGQKFLSREIKVENPKNYSTAKGIAGTIIGILFGIIILFVVILVLLAYRNPKWSKNIRCQSILRNKNVSAIDKELVNMPMDALNTAMEKEASFEEENRCIPVSKLEEYVQNALQSGLLQKEFASAERGQSHSWDISKLPENKAKNRYGNLLAYDHSRVILETIPGNSYSDYINANFVDGYCKPNKYIATQGPKQLTIPDFWKMIWQENVFKIIMCTNLTEGGKTKCEKYWPDGVEKYGTFQVSLTHTEMFADYVIRTLHVTKEGEAREVKHFHFTTWPDHGVPMYATAVAYFMKKTRLYKPDSTSPMVVHCSAGVGRTGTLILIDSMLDMAAAEQRVELTSHLRKMRNQRVNLVETLDQYCFVYQALVDALCRENMAILCANYVSTLAKMKEINPATGKTMFFEQFQRLAKICPSLKITGSSAATDPINHSKNRSMNIIPPDNARPILAAPRDNPKSTYINAVYVDGYRKKDAFIVTQIPLTETISDFWNMLYHAQSNTIVLLNTLEPTDETSPQYWPETSKRFYDIEVRNVELDAFGDIAIRTFELKKQKEEVPKIVKQFHLTTWHPSNSLPPSDHLILYLIEKVQRWQQQSKDRSIVVQCLNGVRACGIYCTSVFICDKVKAEQEVDAFLAVKSIRNNRPEFIENEEQYIYCHQIALAYLDSFETYANFQ